MNKVSIAKPEGKRAVLSKVTGEAGRPLPEAVRVDLEIKFSANLAGVRIHTGALGDEIARSLDAEAVTIGQHIFFQTGKWKPETADGMNLLIHETAHTLQHAGPLLNQPLTSVSQPGDAVERAAEAKVDQSATKSSTTQQKTEPRPTAEGTVARRVAGIAPRERRTADPARTIEELGRALLLRTRADSRDSNGRIRNQLIRMEDNLRRDVLRWLENHMESHDWRSFVNLLAEEPPAGTEGTEDGQSKEEANTEPAQGKDQAGPVPADEALPKEDGKEQIEQEGREKAGAQKDQPGAGKAGGDGSDRQMSPEEAAVEEAAAEGKAGPQEAGVAKPAIEAAGGEESATAEDTDTQAAAATDAPQQAQATTSPKISAPPQAAQEPAGGGAGAVAAEAPALAGLEDSEAASTGEAVAGKSEPAALSAESHSSEEVGTTTDQTASRSQEEVASTLDAEAGPAQETEPPTSGGAGSAAANSSGTAETAGAEAAETSSESSPTPVAEPQPQSAETATVSSPISDPVSNPIPETPPPAPVSETAEPLAVESAAVAETASDGQSTAPESVPESPSATAEPAANVESQPADSGIATDAGAGTPGSNAATAGGVEQAGPASLPPGLLGEFAGEPSEAEPPAAPSGGGGGAAVAAPPPPPEAEDTIPAGKPAEAMQTIGSMKVGPASRAMGATAATVSARTNQKRDQLAKHPPTIERPTGSPQGAPGTTVGNVPKSPPGGAPQAVATVASGAPVPIAAPLPAPELGPSVTQKVAPPRVTGTAEGKLSQADVDNIKESVEDIPVTDPELDQTVPPAPDLELTNDADPSLADKQRTALMESAATNLREGGQEAAAPMGEDHIYPKVEPGTITPDASGSCDCGGGQKSNASSGGGGKAERGMEAIAEQESGVRVRQAANSGAGEVAQKQIDQEHKENTAHADSQKAVTTAIEENAHQQSDDRTQARKDVLKARNDWTDGQQAAVDTAQKDSDTAVTGAHGEIAKEQTRANKEANGHINAGNEKIAKARADGESKAKIAKIKAEEDDNDGGFFSWATSKVTGFFNDLRDAIHDVFDFARKLVKDAIELAQELVHEVIDLARKAIVGLIKIAGEAIALAGGILLAAFPDLQKKFRAKIESAVDSAVTAVNELADALDNAIKTLLNGLLTALNALLCLYEKILNAIVDKVASVVNGAIAAAKAIVAAFKLLAAIIGDIADDPGQWISNFADSVMDGMRNHLWKALKDAVRKWFNDLVESILGMGRMLLNLLFKGGLSLRKIGGFVWQALVAALPGIIVEFLIEQLIKMIIPVAGAIVAIVQGLMAAWGAIQKIIAAFQLFFAFLKAVKDGNAGPQFATALAASAIAVLQFLASYLIARMGKAASGVGGRLKALAQKIMAFFKRVGKRLIGAARKVGGLVVKGAKAVGHLAKRGVRAVGRGIKAVGRVARKVLSKTKAGRTVLRTYDKAKKKVGEWREKYQKWREKKKHPLPPQQRLDRAVAGIRPKLVKMLGRGVGRIWLGVRLAAWRLQYRLSSLKIEGHQIVARINPNEPLTEVEVDIQLGSMLEPILKEAEQRYIKEYEDSRAADWIVRDDPAYKVTADQAPSNWRDPHTPHHLPVNKETDDIWSLRAGRSGDSGALRHEPYTMQSTGAVLTSNWSEEAIAKRAQKKLLEQGGKVPHPRTPSYPYPANLSALKVQAGSEASYDAIEGGWNRRGIPSIDKLRSSKSLTTLAALERARGEGMLVAMDVAMALGQAGHATAGEITYGDFAPMNARLAAQTTERDAVRTFIAKTKSPLEEGSETRLRTARKYADEENRKKYDENAQKEAQNIRHLKVLNIFKRLHHVVDQKLPIAAAPGSSRFPELADAFKRWMDVHLDPKRINEKGYTNLLLVEQLAVFLRMYRGG